MRINIRCKDVIIQIIRPATDCIAIPGGVGILWFTILLVFSSFLSPLSSWHHCEVFSSAPRRAPIPAGHVKVTSEWSSAASLLSSSNIQLLERTLHDVCESVSVRNVLSENQPKDEHIYSLQNTYILSQRRRQTALQKPHHSFRVRLQKDRTLLCGSSLILKWCWDPALVLPQLLGPFDPNLLTWGEYLCQMKQEMSSYTLKPTTPLGENFKTVWGSGAASERSSASGSRLSRTVPHTSGCRRDLELIRLRYILIQSL